MMIGYHASHEQFPPSQLIQLAIRAEKAGFQSISCSDHFHPWSNIQGQSGFAWSWLGAAMQATSLPFRVVNAPGERYHPAIIAQAAATLGEMFPERFWIALGSGQALNESITGQKFPAKEDRNQRLKECQEVMRRLWSGELLTYYGKMVTVEQAKLYTRPQIPPVIIGAAITTQTAEWIGSWADAMITISRPVEELKKVIEAFRQGGGKGKPILLKAQISYHANAERARQEAFEQWKTNIFASSMLAELRLPSQFEAAAEFVKPNDLDKFVKISSDPEEYVEWLQQYFDLGISEISIHNVNRDHEPFIDTFGSRVLPKFKKE